MLSIMKCRNLTIWTTAQRNYEGLTPPRPVHHIRHMTAITFASAYRSLTAPEKAYVDDYVQQLERAADRAGEQISVALYRPIPPALVEASGGMLMKPMVLAAISERVTQIAADTEINVRRIVREYSAIAFSNIQDYMEICPVTGRPTYNLGQCTPEQLAAVRKIKHKISVVGSEEFEFETYDKLKALEALAKMFGLLQEENPYVDQIRRVEKDAKMLVDKSADASEAYAAYIGA